MVFVRVYGIDELIMINELIDKLREKEEFDFEDIEIGDNDGFNKLCIELKKVYGNENVNIDNEAIKCSVNNCKILLSCFNRDPRSLAVYIKCKHLEHSSFIPFNIGVENIITELQIIMQRIKDKQRG